MFCLSRTNDKAFVQQTNFHSNNLCSMHMHMQYVIRYLQVNTHWDLALGFLC